MEGAFKKTSIIIKTKKVRYRNRCSYHKMILITEVMTYIICQETGDEQKIRIVIPCTKIREKDKIVLLDR